ncbi:MmgE/PrpD family protein [Solihabitans fulvus]|uniref:MmgE/PrpD family protein n=1 Tax=Solihabitans fulvus TaxID=1892852 RepID=A0A5B2WGF8_9PSEU|nr:MmgE/PrpD family protein [Solihabitans fulvus]KAA2250951.1 MmgE/PrpD family protein [Solihabitans fulvus]
MTLLAELATWASKLAVEDAPERVVALAKSQVLSQLAAVRAGLSHPLGRAVVTAFGPPTQADVKQSACVLAGLTAWLQMDDTAYAGHLSNSTVNVPLAYAAARGASGRELLGAVIAANECAARLTAAATLGPFRGQSATYTHLAGAVAGRSHLESADWQQWAHAMALAFGMPPRVIPPAFLASDTKVFNAFTPVRAGLDACDAASAGLTGALDVIEHPDGFLSRFSSIPLPEAVTEGLGERWHTDTLSFKLHPGGPGVDAAVDCAAELARELGPLRQEDVDEVVVHASWYTVFVDRRIASFATGPDAPLSVLVVSTPYTVATTLLTGELLPSDFAGERLADPARWALADRVRVLHDPELTRDSFRSDVPFGAALRLAGPKAAKWEFGSVGQDVTALGLGDLLAELGPPSETFEDATKVTGARVTVRLRDGRTAVRQQDIPLGGAGPHTRANHPELIRAKFLRGGGSPSVADAVADLDRLPAGRLAELVEEALRPPYYADA